MNNQYTNHLIEETSPYLLQHAHNPVDWFPWGDKALQAAKEQDKPILASIGYSACHWCHVMEKESFEDKQVAAYMNEHFINIKIDREERPDLDHIYMDAVQAIAGSGGWPLNVFLTPVGKPFYGGTYFPPVKAFNRPSWNDVLYSIAEAWKTRRQEVEQQAETLLGHLQNANSFGITKSISPGNEQPLISKNDCITIVENLLMNADMVSGGFGKAPKFPQTFSIQTLLHYFHYFNDPSSLKHAEFSLQKMLNGGIYDHLAGGMARYSTDDQWLVPHFEKMLYDNALLVSVCCDAYQITKNDFYKNAIDKTIRFLVNEMKHRDGGYYAALDADSEGEEGKFYVWQKSEIEQVLGRDATLYCAYYGITEEGNWEGKNILNILHSPERVAAEFNIPPEHFANIITSSDQLLLWHRNKRIRPGTDDKILIGWNALFLTALCKSYASTGYEGYKLEATSLFEFIIEKFNNTNNGGLFHTYKNGVAKYPAFLDDYAYLIQACIQLQEITSGQSYLMEAKKWTGFVLDNFQDQDTDFFFFTRKEQEDIVVRKVELYDGATPSANAIMAHNLLYLSIVFDEKSWGERANRMINAMAQVVTKYPTSFGVWAPAIIRQVVGMPEIVITGKNIGDVLKEVLGSFIPDKILQSSWREEELPLLQHKSYSGSPLIYLCKNYQCLSPVNTTYELIAALKMGKQDIQG